MKKTIITVVLTVLVMCLIFAGLILGAVAGIRYLHSGPGLVLFNSQFTDIPVIQEDGLICIPLLQTLDRMYYDITQQEEGTYLIEKGSKQYVLNYEEETMFEVGDTRGINYIGGAPGISDNLSFSKNGDIYLSVSTFREALDSMRSGYYILGAEYIKVVVIFPRIL